MLEAVYSTLSASTEEGLLSAASSLGDLPHTSTEGYPTPHQLKASLPHSMLSALEAARAGAPSAPAQAVEYAVDKLRLLAAPRLGARMERLRQELNALGRPRGGVRAVAHAGRLVEHYVGRMEDGESSFAGVEAACKEADAALAVAKREADAVVDVYSRRGGASARRRALMMKEAQPALLEYIKGNRGRSAPVPPPRAVPLAQKFATLAPPRAAVPPPPPPPNPPPPPAAPQSTPTARRSTSMGASTRRRRRPSATSLARRNRTRSPRPGSAAAARAPAKSYHLISPRPQPSTQRRPLSKPEASRVAKRRQAAVQAAVSRRQRAAAVEETKTKAGWGLSLQRERDRAARGTHATHTTTHTHTSGVCSRSPSRRCAASGATPPTDDRRPLAVDRVVWTSP